MGIFEGRLKLEAQVLVKSTSLLVGRGYYPRHPLAAKLHERVVETEPQVLAAEPFATGDCSNVHQQVRAIEVLIQDTGDEALGEVEKANCRATPRRPCTTSAGTDPRAYYIILPDEDFLHLKALRLSRTQNLSLTT